MPTDAGLLQRVDDELAHGLVEDHQLEDLAGVGNDNSCGGHGSAEGREWIGWERVGYELRLRHSEARPQLAKRALLDGVDMLPGAADEISNLAGRERLAGLATNHQERGPPEKRVAREVGRVLAVAALGTCTFGGLSFHWMWMWMR